MPLVLRAASIMLLLTWAEPFDSMYLIGFGFAVPIIVMGSFPELVRKFAPNFFKGIMTLVKSLFERLLSPIILVLNFVCVRSPNINLPKVPEFPAFKITFLELKPFNPKPLISQFFFVSLTLTPNFLKEFRVLRISSDLRIFVAIDFSFDCQIIQNMLVQLL
mgnify:FL=1